MEKDFHYYLIYALAKVTGSTHPEIIAYASQFTDDNNEGQFSVNGSDVFFPEKLKANGGYYYPIMTQSLSPMSFDPYVQRYVYVPFHFLPGDNTMVIKGKKNPLSTTPNSKYAKAILSKAFESGSPHGIGLALHMVADTWSHQNFSGRREEWNAVYPWYHVFKSIVPNIGHAEAGHLPDIISESWTDYRFGTKKIDNRPRALEAAQEIYSSLRKISKKGPLWKGVEDEIYNIIYTKDYDARIRKITEFLMVGGYGPIPNYSKDVWIDAALDKSGDELVMKPNFTKTDWYYFHQAAKVHLASVLEVVGELL
jgi:hypothetical protein